VVAKKLTKPTALVVMPDGTALVGERTTGRILRVQPTPGVAPRLEQTLTGLDATGDGGLLDLAVSPTFNQDGLLYAYITTATDNRVVHFALGTTPTPVLTGIPKGATGNTGRIAFDSAGALLTGTGDAGRPALVSDPASLAGKILRTDDLGKPWPGNPTPGSPVFASGLRSISGLCVNALTGTRFAISTTPEDAVNVIKPGKDYGTAAATGTLPAKSGAGGCTVSRGRLVVAARNDMALEITGLDEKDSFKTFSQTIQKRYGRLLTVVGASDGALWITTSNRDGKGKPGPDDDRVIRIVDIDAGGGSVV
jgi:glucose/arabinose dehydrogenase